MILGWSIRLSGQLCKGQEILGILLDKIYFEINLYAIFQQIFIYNYFLGIFKTCDGKCKHKCLKQI